jgi:hypothetical protein
MEKMWLTLHWNTRVLFSHLWTPSEMSNSGFSKQGWRRRLPGCYVLSTATVTDVSKRSASIFRINPADGRTTPIHNAGKCLTVDNTRPNVPKDLNLYHEYGGNIQTASNTALRDKPRMILCELRITQTAFNRIIFLSFLLTANSPLWRLIVRTSSLRVHRCHRSGYDNYVVLSETVLRVTKD